MLTHHDVTVKDAGEIFEQCKDLPVKFWGFKNVGLPKDEMKKVAGAMKAAGKTTFLEVVTYDEASCLDGAQTAIDCGFDYLMGTVYYDSVAKLLKENGMAYLPFVGKVSGSPIPQTTASAQTSLSSTLKSSPAVRSLSPFTTTISLPAAT